MRLEPGEVLRRLMSTSGDVPEGEAVDQLAADVFRTTVALRGPQTRAALLQSARSALRGLPVGDLSDGQLADTLEQLIDERDLLSLREPVTARDAEALEGPERLHAHPLCLVTAGDRGLLVGVDLALEQALSPRIRRQGRRRWLDPACATSLPVLSAKQWAEEPTAAELSASLARVRQLVAQGTALGSDATGEVLRPGQWAWTPLDGAPSGLHLVRIRGRWDQASWLVVDFRTPGSPGPTMRLPCEALPSSESAYGQARILHILLSKDREEPPAWTERDVGGDVVEATLGTHAPPWLARQLDLIGDRQGGAPRRWSMPASRLSVFRDALRGALFVGPAPAQ